MGEDILLRIENWISWFHCIIEASWLFICLLFKCVYRSDVFLNKQILCSSLWSLFRNLLIDQSVHSKFPIKAILPLDVFEEVLRNLATPEDTVTLKSVSQSCPAWPRISLPETPLRIYSLNISTFQTSAFFYSASSQHRIIFTTNEVQLWCSGLRSASPLGVLWIQFWHDLDLGTAAPSQKLEVGRVYWTWG